LLPLTISTQIGFSMISRRYLLSLAVLILVGDTFANYSTAQEQAPPVDPIVNQYQPQIFDASNELHLPYRLYEPFHTSQSSKIPLLIFLHGAGERGTDNLKQLKHGAKEFTTDDFQKKYPWFVIAPQCRPEHKWCEVDWSAASVEQPANPGAEMTALFELIDKFISTHAVDRERIYLTGLSMGGFGTWDAIARRPHFFAAAVPICGGGDVKTAPTIKGLPIWVFHGGADPVVPVELSRKMVAAIKAAGGEPKYTEYEGVAHDSWTQTYKNDELFQWLFHQKAKQ
jgi:predicted peptidase